ncbi:MAG: hypothetical protein AAB794_00315 [Patescibacteria group bacterium]
MKIPPDPRTPYILDKEQDQRIFAKLGRFQKRKLTSEEEKLVAFLYSQLETDWRTPLEEFTDDLLR